MTRLLPLLLLCFTATACIGTPAQAEDDQQPAFGQGIMIGELTSTSAVVQVRVTRGTKLVDGETYDDGDALRDGDQPGVEWEVAFAVVPVADNEAKPRIHLAKATAENDFFARYTAQDLEPGKEYTVAAVIVEKDGEQKPIAEISAFFTTLAGKDKQALIRFHVVTGLNYDKFYGNEGAKRGYQGDDRHLGYPALDAMRKLDPNFIVYTGDTIYYDKKPRVKTLADLRAKWHRQFAQPRFIEFNKVVPGYHLKDDHDHRTNDSDAEGDYFPSHELGIRTFREQVPIYADTNDKRPTYRTHRVSKDLQIWLLEGRDYRDANKKPDGPDKTLWGKEQLAWLKKTLVASDATYRLIISPTPMVGPDDGYKRDNHTNPKGFKHEGDAFKQWAAEQGLFKNGTFFVCGDRHWQYHSIDPTGAHEFSSGAICDANSRLGRKPGSKGSTDPLGLIKQPYTQSKPSGGFLSVVCEPPVKLGHPATLRFEFYDEKGEKLYDYDATKK